MHLYKATDLLLSSLLGRLGQIQFLVKARLRIPAQLLSPGLALTAGLAAFPVILASHHRTSLVGFSLPVFIHSGLCWCEETALDIGLLSNSFPPVQMPEG